MLGKFYDDSTVFMGIVKKWQSVLVITIVYWCTIEHNHDYLSKLKFGLQDESNNSTVFMWFKILAWFYCG
jgi:hypothetical protein